MDKPLCCQEHSTQDDGTVNIPSECFYPGGTLRQ